MDRSARVDRTALVVEDDMFVLSALAELLSEDGYDVHTASNGFSGLRLAADVHPAVILLDLELPERSGADVLADLRADAATHDVAIVIVSAHVDELSQAQLAEIDGLVPKPFDVDELLRTVDRAVQRAGARVAEVAPIEASSHRDLLARKHRAPTTRRTRRPR